MNVGGIIVIAFAALAYGAMIVCLQREQNRDRREYRRREREWHLAELERWYDREYGP